MATLNFPKMVSDSDKSLENYIKGFDRVLSGQKKISNDFKSLQKKITNNIAIESCDVIKAALQCLRDAIEAVNDARDKAVTSRMQSAVLEKLRESRSLTVKPMVQLQATVAKDKSNWLKKNEEDAKIKYELEAAELYEKMGDFEKKRSKELQRTLKEFCNSQLFYHCHAVENWTKALQKVSELDMEEWYACVDVNVLSMMKKEGLHHGN